MRPTLSEIFALMGTLLVLYLLGRGIGPREEEFVAEIIKGLTLVLVIGGGIAGAYLFGQCLRTLWTLIQ